MRRTSKLFSLAAAITTMVLAAPTNRTEAVLLDFNSINGSPMPAGTILTDQYATNPDIGLVISGVGGSNLCVLYPSHVSGGNDPDLEGPPFVTGNVANEFIGNVLIVQEVQNLGGGVLGPTAAEIAARQLSVTPPDDEPGFSIQLDFDSRLDAFGFTWVDLDDSSGNAAEVVFIDTTQNPDLEVTVGFEEFLSGSGAFPQDAFTGPVGWDDGSADRIEKITAVELSFFSGQPAFTGFNRVVFNVSTSGGLGALFYDDPNVLAVELVDFAATDFDKDGHVDLSWETSEEIDSAAFNIRRLQHDENRSAQLGPRITENPIPAVGENGGATYSFTDPQPLANRDDVRGYYLEEIELDGTSSYYGPIWFNNNSTAIEDWLEY